MFDNHQTKILVPYGELYLCFQGYFQQGVIKCGLLSLVFVDVISVMSVYFHAIKLICVEWLLFCVTPMCLITSVESLHHILFQEFSTKKDIYWDKDGCAICSKGMIKREWFSVLTVKEIIIALTTLKYGTHLIRRPQG